MSHTDTVCFSEDIIQIATLLYYSNTHHHSYLVQVFSLVVQDLLNAELRILSLAHTETLPLIYIPPLHYVLWLLPTIEGTKPQIKQFS